MSELFIFYTLLITVFILSGILIILIQYLFNTLKENKLYQKDIESSKKDIVNHSQHVLDEAREKAREIINTANDKAQEIIRQTEIFSRETSDSSNQILATLRKIQQEELEKTHRELLDEYINLFKNISRDIEEKANSEIKDFKEILEKETLSSQRIVGEKIESRYQEVQKEIENYKNSELAKVRENIYKIVENAIRLAIGKSLDYQTHEDLIMEALKEAIEKEAQNLELKTQNHNSNVKSDLT